MSINYQEGARISPNTGSVMQKVTILGDGKTVTIDVDEQGGVFLDPSELAELAETVVEEVVIKLIYMGGMLQLTLAVVAEEALM